MAAPCTRSHAQQRLPPSLPERLAATLKKKSTCPKTGTPGSSGTPMSSGTPFCDVAFTLQHGVHWVFCRRLE